MNRWLKARNTSSVIDEIGPVDRDLSLAADYLTGEASAAQAAEFEQRMLEDEAFFTKVAPVVDLWTMPMDVRAAVGSERPQAVASPPATPSPSSWDRYKRQSDVVRKVVGFAAAVMTIVATSAYLYLAIQTRNAAAVAELRKAGQELQGNGPAAAALLPGASAPGLATDSLRAAAKLGWYNLYGPTIKATGEEVRAGDSSAKVVELPGGARLLLRPGTTIRHKAIGVGAKVESVWLEGEVAVWVPAAKAGLLAVATPAGIVMLSPGSYALRCRANCAAAEVTVLRGHARVSNQLEPASSVNLADGEHALGYRVGAPVAVSRAAAGAFPQADSTLGRTP